MVVAPYLKRATVCTISHHTSHSKRAGPSRGLLPASVCQHRTSNSEGVGYYRLFWLPAPSRRASKGLALYSVPVGVAVVSFSGAQARALGVEGDEEKRVEELMRSRRGEKRKGGCRNVCLGALGECNVPEGAYGWDVRVERGGWRRFGGSEAFGTARGNTRGRRDWGSWNWRKGVYRRRRAPHR
eukprot:2573669-Rhodomonas_salina.1